MVFPLTVVLCGLALGMGSTAVHEVPTADPPATSQAVLAPTGPLDRLFLYPPLSYKQSAWPPVILIVFVIVIVDHQPSRW